MSALETWSFSITGQCLVPLPANPLCHGQGQDRPIPGETNVPSRQTSQPENHGASDSSRDNSLDETLQSESRTGASTEGATEADSREPDVGIADDAHVISPKLTRPRTTTNGASDAGTAERANDAPGRLRQTEAVGASDAVDANEHRQATSPQGRTTPDTGREADVRPGTECRADEQGNDDELREQSSTLSIGNTNGASDARQERYVFDGESDSNLGSHHSEDNRPNGEAAQNQHTASS